MLSSEHLNKISRGTRGVVSSLTKSIGTTSITKLLNDTVSIVKDEFGGRFNTFATEE